MLDLLAGESARRDRRARAASGRRRSRSRSAARLTVVGRSWGRRVWLARLETAVTADQVVDALVSAVDGPGGEAALFERLKDSAAVVILDNCEHVLDAAAALAVRLLDAAPGCGSCARARSPLDIDGEVVFELAPLAALRRRRAVHPPRRGTTPTATPSTSDDDAVRRPVPLPGRPAAGDRARRGPDQDAVGRGDHPAPRRPVPRAQRPDQPQAGAPPVAAVDDRVELRPAVPRRPARPVGAGHLRRRRAAAGGGVRPRSPRRAGGRGDRRGRPAREPLPGDRRRRGAHGRTERRTAAIRFGTGCSTASGRSRSRR